MISHPLLRAPNPQLIIGQLGGHVKRGITHPRGQRTGKTMALVSALPLEPGSDKMVLACLLHDISTIGFIRGDHGYWGAQLIEPYVDEEITWAIRAHQVLRFYPDESVGYEYPQSYIKTFGADYRPDAYVEEDYKRMRNHKWYMSGRMITVHDIYSFDPDAVVALEEFTDVIGRAFRQPEQGLGFDNSPVAHMWRAMIRPAKYL